MDEILQFLITHCSFLYREYGLKFVDSEASGAFGGNAYLVLASDDLYVRMIRDRGQFLLDFQSRLKLKRKPRWWYTVDLVRQLVTREEGYSSTLDHQNVEFLRRHFPEILERFSPSRYEETRAELEKLAKVRSERVSG